MHKVHVVLKESKASDLQDSLSQIFESSSIEEGSSRDVACSSPLLRVTEMERVIEETDTRKPSSDSDETVDDDDKEHLVSLKDYTDGDDDNSSSSEREERSFVTFTECQKDNEGLEKDDQPAGGGKPEQHGEEMDETREDACQIDTRASHPQHTQTQLSMLMESLKGAVTRMKFIFG